MRASASGYALLALIVSANLAAQDALILNPDPGASPVGSSQNLSYTAGTLRVSGGLSRVQLLQPTDASPSWRLNLAAPSGTQLATGCYERALRFGTTLRPEIDFSFNGAGCNQTFGRFRVIEVTAQGGAITGLAVDFALQCESFGGAVLGKLRFNSQVPTTGGFLEPVVSTTGNLSFNAQPGAVGGTAPGGVGNIALTRGTTRPSINFDNGMSFAYSGPLPGGASGFWQVDFAAPGNAALVPGNYPGATRFPFQAISEAGLSFSYNGAGCNTLFGAFDLTTVRYDGLDSVPLDLVGTFSQRCSTTQSPLTTGSISYAATVIGPTSLYGEGVLFRSRFEDGDKPSLYFPSCQ